MGAVLSVEEKNRRIIAARELGERLGREISVEKIAPVLDVTDAKGVIFNTDLLETISDTGYSTAIGNRYYSVEPFLSNLIDTLLARNLIEFVGVIDRAAIHREKLAKARERYRAAIREKRAKHAELLTQKFGFKVETDDVLYVGEAFAEIAEKSDLSKKNTIAKKYLSPEVFAANFVYLGASRFATARQLLPILKADIIKNRAEILEKKRRAKEEEIRFSRATQAAHAAEVEKRREERARAEQARREKQIQQLKEKRAAKVAKRAVKAAAHVSKRHGKTPRKTAELSGFLKKVGAPTKYDFSKSENRAEVRRRTAEIRAFSKKIIETYRKTLELEVEVVADRFKTGVKRSDYDDNYAYCCAHQKKINETMRAQICKFFSQRLKRRVVADEIWSGANAQKHFGYADSWSDFLKKHIFHFKSGRWIFFLKSDVENFMFHRDDYYKKIAWRGLSAIMGRKIDFDDVMPLQQLADKYYIPRSVKTRGVYYWKCCFISAAGDYKKEGDRPYLNSGKSAIWVCVSELAKHFDLQLKEEAKKE